MDDRHQPSAWRPGIPAQPRSGSAQRRYVALLDRLVREQEVPREDAKLGRHASASQPPSELAEEQRRAAAERLARAESEAEEFQTGLELARRFDGEASFDSADPAQDRVVGVLIRHLVTTGYASVRTEQLESGHYRYYVDVDWPELDELASQVS